MAFRTVGVGAAVRSSLAVVMVALAALPATAAAPSGDPLRAEPARAGSAGPLSRPNAALTRWQGVCGEGAGGLAQAQTVADRAQRLGAVRSWGYQLTGLGIEAAAASPYDLLVVDATAGLAEDRPMNCEEIRALQRKPDGSRRMVVSYLSIGEVEDYRLDYYDPNYLEEDAPDWLLKENPKWQGNRVVKFCAEGWQRTIIGDDTGASPYNSTEPSPLMRLVAAGFDGVYLDRADVYAEVEKECPGARGAMLKFIARIAMAARAMNPGFVVILQNAEELLADRPTLEIVDAIAKEDLYFGADHTEAANGPKSIATSLGHLKRAKAAGKPVFVIDYLKDKAKIAEARQKIEAAGFLPYFAPRDLGRLWLPGIDF